MCVLSDREIQEEIEQGELGIDPFHISQLKPNGYDWTLGGTILRAKTEEAFWPLEDSSEQLNLWDTIYEDLPEGTLITLYPDQFYLAVTRERLVLPRHIMATMTGRSSLGRLGLLVHATAGDFDPGFTGWGTAEMKVLGPWPVKLRVGQSVGKFVFQYMYSEASQGYNDWPGSKYADQPNVPVPSRFVLPGGTSRGSITS